MRSSSSAPLFRTLFTARLTGHSRNTSSAAGRSSAVLSPSSSPNHTGQSAASSTTGIRPCRTDIVPFAAVVISAKVRTGLTLRRTPALPEAGKRQLRTVPPRDGIRLLAVRHRLPLVERIARHQRTTCRQGATEHPDVPAVSDRALIGLRAAFFEQAPERRPAAGVTPG